MYTERENTMTKYDGTGKILDNKYTLVSLIGEGGMGVVYEAQHELINRRLAVKFLHPQYADNAEAVARFQREAQAAAKIGHENIIEITDMGKTADDGPYIVMEYLEGADVQRIIEAEGPLSVERTARIMVQALSALQAAHKVQIIHRDLKPENIFLIRKFSTPDFVKLLDFGISKFRALENDGLKPLTQTGAVLGTPHYMSPEQAMGNQALTPQSDIYSMGVIMYQMLTGHMPFDAPNYNALLMKILTEEPLAPEMLNPDLPEDIAATIQTAMARDPEDRFIDCDAFKTQLLAYVPEIAAEPNSRIALGSGRLTPVKKTQTATTTPLEMAQSGITRPGKKLPLSVAAAATVLLAIVAGIIAIAIASGEKTSATSGKTQKIQVAASRSDKQIVSEVQKKAGTPLSQQVTLSVHVQPETASISIDGATVENPYNGKFLKNDVNRLIVITAPGYVGVSEIVTFNRDMKLSYELLKTTVQKQTMKKKSKKRHRGNATPKPAEENTADSAAIDTLSEIEETPASQVNPRIIDKTNPWDD